MSYTKGPWVPVENSAYWDIIVKGDGYQPQVASVWEAEEITPEQQETNARLIASAPELLEALKDVRSSLAYYHERSHLQDEVMLMTGVHVAKIDRIIAKAEGTE